MSHPVFPTQDHHTVSIQPKWLHWLHSYHGLEKQDGITVLLAAADYVVSCEGFDDVCHMNQLILDHKFTSHLAQTKIMYDLNLKKTEGEPRCITWRHFRDQVKQYCATILYLNLKHGREKATTPAFALKTLSNRTLNSLRKETKNGPEEKTVSRMPKEHYVSASSMLAEKLKKVLLGRPLDVVCSLTDPLDVGTHEPKLKVVNHKVELKEGGYRYFVVLENALSQTYCRKVARERTKLKWLQTNGKQHRLLRVAGDVLPDGRCQQFLMGQSANTRKTVAATEMLALDTELKTLALYVTRIFDGLVETTAEEMGYTHYFQQSPNLNTIQHLIAPPEQSVYGKHNDIDAMNCDKASAPVDARSPRDYEVSVLTFNFSNISESDLKKSKCCYNLFQRGKKILAAPLTSPSLIHIQTAAMQTDDLEHDVTIEKQGIPLVGNDSRCSTRYVVSCRSGLMMCQKTEEECIRRLNKSGLEANNNRKCDYTEDDYTIYFHPQTNHQSTFARAMVRQGSTDTRPSKRNATRSRCDDNHDITTGSHAISPIPTRKRRNIAGDTNTRIMGVKFLSDQWEVKKKMNIPTMYRVQHASPPKDMASNKTFCAGLLLKGHLPTIREGEKATVYFGPLLDGEEERTVTFEEQLVVDANILLADVGRSNGSRYFPTWNHKGSSYINTVFLRRGYKQDMKGLSKELSNIKQGKKREGFSLYGRGGSPTCADDFAVKLSSKIAADKNRAHVTIGASQRIDTAPNLALLNASVNQNVVRVFVDTTVVEMCLPGTHTEKASASATRAQYLGLYYLDGASICSHSLEEILEEAGVYQFNRNVERYMRFKETFHIQSRLNPLFEKEKDNMIAHSWKQIYIRDDAPRFTLPYPIRPTLALLDDTCSPSTFLVKPSEDGGVSWLLSQDGVSSDSSLLHHDVDNSQSSEKVGSGLLVSPPEVVLSSCLVSVAGFYRLQTGGAQEGICHIEDSSFDSLGTILRATACYMSCRTYDVSTLFFIQSVKNRNIQTTSKSFSSLLFSATVNRLLGRAGALWQWQDGFHLPETCTLADFSTFIKSICGESGSSSCFISPQFSGCLPSTCRKVSSLLAMLESLSDTIADLGSKCEEEASGSENDTKRRKRVVDATVDWLKGSIISERGNDLVFIANQIILDLEEVFEESPFGIASTSDVYFGPGGRAGLDAMRAGRDPSTKCTEDELCATLLDSLHAASDQELRCLGMYKEDNGSVRVCLNKRIITIFDAEHMLCKSAMLLRKTQPQRVTSNTSPYIVNCHPAKIVGAWNHQVYHIAQEAICAFTSGQGERKLQIPEQYSHPADYTEGGIFCKEDVYPADGDVACMDYETDDDIGETEVV